MNRDFFKWDFELIGQIGGASNLNELQLELDDYWYHSPPKGFLKGTLHIRVSGKRLMSLGVKLFSEAG